METIFKSFFSLHCADFPRNSSLKHIRCRFLPAAHKQRISRVRWRLWRQIWGRSLKVQHWSETSHTILSSLSPLTHTKAYDNYNCSTITRSLPHNLHHTLPLFTADKLRSAHAQQPQIVLNTPIQTRISWKINAIRGKNF